MSSSVQYPTNVTCLAVSVFKLVYAPLDTLFSCLVCWSGLFLSVSARIAIKLKFPRRMFYLRARSIFTLSTSFVAESRHYTCANPFFFFFFCKHTNDFPSMHCKTFIADLQMPLRIALSFYVVAMDTSKPFFLIFGRGLLIKNWY